MEGTGRETEIVADQHPCAVMVTIVLWRRLRDAIVRVELPSFTSRRTHGFFDNGQYPVPSLPGGLIVGCIELRDGFVVLGISGFATKQQAADFVPSIPPALTHTLFLPRQPCL